MRRINQCSIMNITEKPVFFSSLALALLLMLTGLQATAQTSRSPDEQAIRNLVAQENDGKNAIKYTDDRVFISEPFPRPITGKLSEEEQRTADSLNAERLNWISKLKIIRLAVAKSGDIAYEYGEGTVDYDNPRNEHVHFTSSYVRVWKKIKGEWLVDVAFFRRNR